MKKNISKIILITIAFLMCASCGGKTEKTIKIIKLNQAGEEALCTSTFADTVIYIPLETKSESLIKQIDNLWINDSLIIILHKNGLLKFDRNGKFIKQIGTRGRGPNEYEGTFNFAVICDTIYLSPTGRSGFLRYTLDGSFCDFIKLQTSDRPTCFNSTASQKLAVYENINGEIYVFNKYPDAIPDTIKVEYGVSKRRSYRSITDEGPWTFLQKTSSGLLFNNYLNDTIWNISGGMKEPFFIIDTKDKFLPWDKQLEYYSMDQTPKWMEMAKSYHFFHLLPVSPYLFVFQNNWYDDEYAKSGSGPYFNKAVHFSRSETGTFKKYDYIFDDITGNLKLPWFYHIHSDDYLIGMILPFNLLNNSGQGKASPSPLFLNQMKNLKENDNPVLVLVKVKK